MNGSCQEVCPVDIPLPTLLRGWREKSWREGLEPRTTRSALGLWAFGARHPFLYRIGAAVAVRAMRRFSRNGWIKSLPLAKGWTQYRDFPKPAARTFMEELSARQRGRRI
ncbi:conserved hypothetical protein [Methylocella tundrae]|nr:conserved hypothetical protein [Methylocella tundrae]